MLNTYISISHNNSKNKQRNKKQKIQTINNVGNCINYELPENLHLRRVFKHEVGMLFMFQVCSCINQ